MDTPSTPRTEAPHAGKLPEEVRELPVPADKFDNTTLQEAVDNNLIDLDNPPSSPADLLGTGLDSDTSTHVEAVQTQAEIPKSKKRIWLALGGSAAALALAGVAVFGVSTANQAPKDEPVATAPADPSPEASAPTDEVEPSTPVAGENDPIITAENEQSILDSLRFTADMTPQATGENFTNITTRWTNAGATSETWYSWFNGGLPDTDIFAADIAKNNTHVYATALFGADYASITDPKIVNFIKVAEESNQASIKGYLLTYGDEDNPNTNTMNTEALRAEFITLGVTPEDNGNLIVRRETVINDENTMYAGKTQFDGKISDTYIGMVQDPSAPDNKIISTFDIVDIN